MLVCEVLTQSLELLAASEIFIFWRCFLFRAQSLYLLLLCGSPSPQSHSCLVLFFCGVGSSLVGSSASAEVEVVALPCGRTFFRFLDFFAATFFCTMHATPEAYVPSLMVAFLSSCMSSSVLDYALCWLFRLFSGKKSLTFFAFRRVIFALR